MTILGVAAAVTLILGVVGLYGVIAYVVTLRTRELGVRIALGAQPSAVEAMVTKQGLVLSGAGIVVGLGLVLVAARFVRSVPLRDCADGSDCAGRGNRDAGAVRAARQLDSGASCRTSQSYRSLTRGLTRDAV